MGVCFTWTNAAMSGPASTSSTPVRKTTIISCSTRSGLHTTTQNHHIQSSFLSLGDGEKRFHLEYDPSGPLSFVRSPNTTAMAPAAPEIMAGLPPHRHTRKERALAFLYEG